MRGIQFQPSSHGSKIEQDDLAYGAEVGEQVGDVDAQDSCQRIIDDCNEATTFEKKQITRDKSEC